MTEAIIEPVRNTTLVDSAMEQIRDVIENCGLKPGDLIPGEIELAKKLAVSRCVVREATGRLQTMGVLTTARGRKGGTFVGSQDAVMGYASVIRSAMSICDKDIAEFAEFRAALEIYSARLAAVVATDQQSDELEAMCDEIGDDLSDSEIMANADYRFHRRLASVAGNQVVLHTLQVSCEFIKSTIRITGPRVP